MPDATAQASGAWVEMSIKGALHAIRAEWDRPLSEQDSRQLTDQIDMLATYLEERHSGDKQADILARQMRMDQQYVSMSATGKVVIRAPRRMR